MSGDGKTRCEAAEALDYQVGPLEVVGYAQGFTQHGEGICDPTLVAGESRQLIQFRGDDSHVGLRARLAENVLMEGSAVFLITEAAVGPCEAVGRHEGVVIVAKLPEGADALLEDRPCRCPVSFLGRYEAEREDGVGGPPCVAEPAMEHQCLLGPKPRCGEVSTRDHEGGRSVERSCAGGRRTMIEAN